MRSLAIAAMAVCGVLLILAPAISRRDRAPWAKWVFVLAGALAFISAMVNVALGAGWFGEENSTLDLVRYYRVLFNGTVIGLIAALALSGELGGHRKAVLSA